MCGDERDEIIGMSLEEAVTRLPNWIIRPTVVDGRATVVTHDMKGNRLNVEVRDGIVLSIRDVG